MKSNQKYYCENFQQYLANHANISDTLPIQQIYKFSAQFLPYAYAYQTYSLYTF